jgi:hypothetical protein
MSDEREITKFLMHHIQSILDNDLSAYHASTSPDLTLYEWYVTPHRVDGIPFHDFMMESNAARGTVFGAPTEEGQGEEPTLTRFDLANLKIQQYGHTAIATYTLLLSSALSAGVEVVAHNESRVMVKQDGNWQVVHCHKSPAWGAPYTPPAV